MQSILGTKKKQTPEGFDRLRLDDGQRVAPIAPDTGQRNPEEAIHGS